MRIDFHTHYIPEALPDWSDLFGQGRWPTLIPAGSGAALFRMGEGEARKLDPRFWSLERRLVDMDLAKIDIQVLSPIPGLACYWADARANKIIARHFNDAIARAIASHPDRFLGMATVPLQDIEASIQELRYVRDQLGFRAVQIGTCPAGNELDSDFLFPFLEACQQLEMAILVHPIDPIVGVARMKDYYLPNTVGNPLESTLAMARLIYGGVLERLPQLRVCFAHGGGAAAYVLGRIDKAYSISAEARAKISKPPSEYLKQIYVDNLTFDPSTLRLAIEKHGANRVVLGSDYPFGLGETDPAISTSQGSFTLDVLNKIFYENINSLMSRR